jgi:hypothetical protein
MLPQLSRGDVCDRRLCETSFPGIEIAFTVKEGTRGATIVRMPWEEGPDMFQERSGEARRTFWVRKASFFSQGMLVG